MLELAFLLSANEVDVQALVVEKIDSAIHRINRYPSDKY